MILIKSAATRMSNHMLSYRKSKLECWEALLVVRIEHLRVTDQCTSSGRKLEWDTLMIFCDKPLVKPQALPQRVWCMYLTWYGETFILGLTVNIEESPVRHTFKLTEDITAIFLLLSTAAHT